ncbi:MAG: helix-turn-helix domain-containing protein [Spirochaetaceae bacterium]|jgi:transposase|nr:helix-turn-helix domain-containing protein [Spirochaetaceae bacterium]
MALKKYQVVLTKNEEKRLCDIVNEGNAGPQKRKRAQALLLANEGLTDGAIAEQVAMHRRGVEGLRLRFAAEGFEVTLEGKMRGHRIHALTKEDEARLIALANEPVPDGRARWTLRALERAWVTLEHTNVKTVSRETIRRVLKQAGLNFDKTAKNARKV